MLPSSNPLPYSAGGHHSPKASKRLELKNTFQSVKSQISGRRYACLTFTVFLQILIIYSITRESPPPPSQTAVQRQRFESVETDSTALVDEDCRFGRVFVYDLPPLFNKELLDNCHELDPWSSRCNAVSNGGFGPPATGLDGIVPVNLTPAWFWTDMYAAEVIYHERMKEYKCRTLNQDKATAFYIPFYAGLAVGKYLWFNYTSKDRDYHAAAMLDWVKNQNPWRRSNGSDHFIMLGRLTWDFRRLTDADTEWGTKFIYMPLMKNVLRLSVERNKWDELEISVPYPTAFHPRSESDIRQWQNFILHRPRRRLFSFVGATRKKIQNDFRGILMSYCKRETTTCRVVDCSETRCYDGAPAILDAFLDSDFCLQPKGDGYTRRSTFDCMLTGSIPVFFWRGSFENQFQWHLPHDATSYSAFIDRDAVRNDTAIIRRVLERFSREDVNRMRATIAEFLPAVLYSRFGIHGNTDAFEVTMDSVLRRFMFQ